MYEQIYLVEKLEQYKLEEFKKVPYYMYKKEKIGVKKQLCSLPIISELPKCQCI